MFTFARMTKSNKTYKHLFIDLDRTLWDFERSAQQTFEAIYVKHQLKDLGVPSLEEFKVFYTKHNDRLWSYYRKGQIKKEVLSVQRFDLSLKDFSINDIELAKKMANDYVSLSPTMVSLFPYTHEILTYLRSKYVLHIITNGFEEVQQKKLDTADLRQYFTEIITSEKAGAKKPEAEIFDYAFKLTGATKDDSLMIGDDFKVDILGAKTQGIDQIFVNYNHLEYRDKATYEVFALKKIETIL